MSVAQLDAGPGTKSYEMKRSAMFSSQSSFGSRVNGAAAPGSEVTSYSSEKRESSQQIGSEPVIHSESETIKEYKNINGVESRNEKTTESSSSNFSEIVNKHEMLCSGGSHGSIPGLAKSLSNSSISKSSIRKTIAPRFISPLNGKIVDLGADVVLEAIIEGFPTPEVKWSKNGLPISSIPGKLNISFEHNKTRLELKNAGTEDGGRYTVTVENASGSAGCTADLIVKKSIFPPVMCRRLLPQSIYVGDRLVMEVEIAGTPTPTVQFYKDNQPISNYSQEYRLRQQGNSYAVIVEKANTSNSGTYKVTATNEGGEAISTADVRVSDKMAISTVPLPSFNQDLSFPPSSLQTDSKLQQRDFSNSSNFYKQQQQQTQSAYSTQENLSVSKTLVKEDKNSNLKVSNDFMPLNMPYSIQSSSSETHKETIIPVQPDNKTYIENHRTESTTSTQVVNSDQVDSDGIEHKPIPKKCALDFFKNIIKENENEQNFLKETEKPLPPSFYIDKKKEVHHHVENQEYQPSSFPHTDSEIPSEFSRSTFSETKTNTWKPVSPVPQPYTDTPLYLEPGPPPEMCFAPPVKPKETFTEKIKKIEETHKESYTSEVPRVIPDRNPIVEEQCTRTELYKKVTSPPIYQPEYNGHGPVLRPQADIHVRPTSPRPSAEGVSMEKLWTTKLHKESEIVRPASPLARPPSPKVISEIRESSHSEVRRCTSPRPSAEGVKMDKMWAHASNTSSTRTPHPTSLMPEIPVPVPDQKDVEDEEAKRLAWSRKYLQEEESSSLRTVRSSSTPAPAPTPTPVYKPPTPAPVYKPPTPVSAPVYKPPTPAPVYNPPKQPPTPTSQFPPKPVYAAPLLPPYTAPRELPKQQSFDESSFYKQQSSYQTNQKVNPPWVKTEAPQNIVTPPWVKQSPPPTPSQSYTQNFSSSEDRYSSSTQQKPAHFNNYSQPSAYQPFKPKPAASQQYRTESQESQIKQYSTPSFSPYSNQNSNQSNSSVVQQSYSSQTVQESYQSGSNQFSNSQQIPGSFSESSVVEEQHLKPSLANKVWPLVQSSNTNSNYSPVAPPFSSEPVTESTYSHEVIKTDNGYIEKEIKTQKSVQHEEKKFSYPPQCRSALQSKIAAFEEKNYHSDYDSRFDSSDSEMRRRSGSLKRLDRPSSVTGYKTLPKTYGRSNTYNMEYQTRSFSNSDVIPGLKPGSPPQILHASQLYKKGQTQGDSGYMADTEETFQSKISQEGPNVLGSTTKKEKSMFIAPQSQLTSSLQKSSRESYSKATRKHCPPAQNPSKFVKGEFRESDYESDYEGKIRPKWRPYDSDNEEVTFRPVRPSTSEPKRRSFHASQAVPFPFEHETPPVVTDLRPYNPHTQHSGVKTSAFARNTQAQVMRKDFVCPPPPKFDYHSVQNFEPKVFEDTQSMSQSESGENFHRSMNVQQTTRVMTSGGVGVVDADAENRRLQRVEEMKRRFEEKSMIEAKQNSGGDLFSTPHIPSIGSAFSNNSSSVQQLNQSYQTTTSSSSCSSEQFYNSAQHQLTNGTSASHNFGVQNPTPQKVITLPDNFQSYLPEQFRRLPIFITPLRDIAVLSGGVARLECIVQADPTPSITWTKDGQVLHPSHQYNIEFRNGVCRLTLPHAYPFDAGSYSCTAVNAVGTCETSAALTVAGEKRSFHL